MKMRIKTNLISGIVGLVISVVIMFMIPLQIKVRDGDTMLVNQRFIPYLAVGLMLAMSVMLIIQSLVLHKDKIIEIKLKEELRTIIYMTVVLVFAFLMKYVGYLGGSILIICFSFFYFKCRKWHYYVGSSIFVALVYFAFTSLLHIPLP